MSVIERERVFTFPNPVNEKAARAVAGGVVLLAALTLVLSLTVSTTWLWLDAVLVYGFLARVLTGPTLSPLGQLATRVLAAKLGPAKPVPGPPKRFAQAIGLTFTAAALISTAAGAYGLAQILLAVLIAAATLESVFALCLGCIMFGLLMRAGVIPEQTCAACADLSLRHA